MADVRPTYGKVWAVIFRQ